VSRNDGPGLRAWRRDGRPVGAEHVERRPLKLAAGVRRGQECGAATLRCGGRDVNAVLDELGPPRGRVFASERAVRGCDPLGQVGEGFTNARLFRGIAGDSAR
jgi:hypothetical protein